MRKQRHLVLFPFISLMVICGCLDICSIPNLLRSEAIDEGTEILDGVTIEESTPIADIVADFDAYENEFLQIEGVIVEICESQGCRLTLEDPAGNQLDLKVNDGTLDFRDYAEVGNYAVGDGYMRLTGCHGPNVHIEWHGAMIGLTVCPVD